MEKADVFADYLENVFTPNLSNIEEFESIINNNNEQIPPITVVEVKKEIRSLKS